MKRILKRLGRVLLRRVRRRAAPHAVSARAAAPPASAQRPASDGSAAITPAVPKGPPARRSAPPPVAGRTRFHDLDLPESLLRAVADLEFDYCTPIQALALPPALEGRDVAGRAQTGTGKTAAFLIAAFTRFLRQPLARPAPPGTPRGLVLAPTRELAIQIHKDALELGRHANLRVAVVYGGMDYRKQQQALERDRVDLVVATPGRLLDFKSKGVLNLSRAEILVVDEADRMLDMGFIPDVRRIVYSLPPKHRRQTMLFSATLSPDILRLASAWMVEPVMLTVAHESVTVDQTVQKVFSVAARDKVALLLTLLRREPVERMLVFRNRRDGVDRLTRALAAHGVACAPLSGDVPQDKRLRILEGFRAGRIQVVVATDVAGRGIHVEGISHVVNYDVPYEPDDYVHRIGRTGRAGAAGTAITFACEEGAFCMPAIETFIGRKLVYEQAAEDWLVLPPRPAGGPPAGEDLGPVSAPVERPGRGGGRGSSGRGRPPAGGRYRSGPRPRR